MRGRAVALFTAYGQLGRHCSVYCVPITVFSSERESEPLFFWYNLTKISTNIYCMLCLVPVRYTDKMPKRQNS